MDALYTALVMLRSHDPYYVISGGIASGILLVPLLVSVITAATPLLLAATGELVVERAAAESGEPAQRSC